MNANNEAHVNALRRIVAEAKCGELLLNTDEYEALDAAIRALSADRGEAVPECLRNGDVEAALYRWERGIPFDECAYEGDMRMTLYNWRRGFRG